MNRQRRDGPSPRPEARPRSRDGEGSVPAMLARLEAAFPAQPAPVDDRWNPVVRLATLAAGCAGSWGLVVLLIHVAAPLL